MKKLAALLLTCVLLLQAMPMGAYETGNINNQEYLENAVMLNRIIVQFAPGTSLQDKEQLLNQYGLQLLYVIPAPDITYATINTPAANYNELQKLITKLQNETVIAYANPILKTVDNTGYGVLNTLIVKLKQGDDIKVLQNVLVAYQLEAHKYRYADRTYTIPLSKRTSIPALELMLNLQQSGRFEYVQTDFVFNPIVCTNDSLYNRQWNIHNDDSTVVLHGGIHAQNGADMDVDDAWTITTGDPNIHVAVLDAGVDTLHPDLINNLLPGYDATGQGSKGYPNTDKIYNAHGTACSGIIAAEANNGIGIAGVAYSCKIVPIRVFYYIDTMIANIPLNDIPWSTTVWMADAIGYAYQTANADVMSNSWAVPDLLITLTHGDMPMVNAVIHDATVLGRGGLGVPIFFSSGNYDPGSGVAARPLWPSKLPEVFAVNATSPCDEPKSTTSCDAPGSSENWVGHMGDSLDISAPGVKITTLDMTGSLGYNNTNYTLSFNGTSAACPNAAAVMALILSVSPHLTLQQAREIISTTTDTVGGFPYNQVREFGQWSDSLGYGRVNAYKAVVKAQAHVGIANIKADNNTALSIYPNPLGNGDFTVACELQGTADVTVSIFTTEGRLVTTFNDKQQMGTYRHAVSKSVLPSAGLYIVRLTAGSNTYYQRLAVL